MNNDSTAFSIKTAFNLGVWMRQNQKEKDVFEIGRYLRQTIHGNIDQPDDGRHSKEVVEANVDFLLEVALLGYIMSGICSYDPYVKEKVPSLIEKRLVSETYLDAKEEYEGDVSDREDGELYTVNKAVDLN
ncbi:MAG: hypothetical protein RIG61_11665 [Deltaproteobacteria bacterium]